MIIEGYQGIGKSTLAEKDNKYVDVRERIGKQGGQEDGK